MFARRHAAVRGVEIAMIERLHLAAAEQDRAPTDRAVPTNAAVGFLSNDHAVLLCCHAIASSVTVVPAG